MSKITFIGLGNMGLPMAQNLINAGHKLKVYNRTTQKAAELKGDFQTCTSVKEACGGQQIIVSMLSEDDALYQICEGDDGLLSQMEKGAIHISMSTISPDTSRDLAEKTSTTKSALSLRSCFWTTKCCFCRKVVYLYFWRRCR